MVLRLGLPLAVTGAIFCTTAILPMPAHGADFTDILDAADDFDDNHHETYKAFDFHIEPVLRFERGSATISREAPCVPENHESLEQDLVRNNTRLIRDTGRCREPAIVYNKEMDYEETRNIVDVTLGAGLYKDLEFRLTVPYVISSTRGLRYADGVGGHNSSVDPNEDRLRFDARRFDAEDSYQQTIAKFDHFSSYRYFELDQSFSTYERTGFADPSIGLHWAPFNDHRDPTKATLALGIDYVMPIAPIERSNNSAVGGGMHELQYKLAASKKFDWLEPYFGLQYFLPIASSDSPIREIDAENGGQVFVNPPQRGLFTMGAEFIAFEDEASGQRYAVDMRFQFGYTSEGRDYNPLSDHFGNSACNGKTIDDVLPTFDSEGRLSNPDDVACAWVIRQSSNAQPLPVYDVASAEGDNSQWSHDGIMTVEGYAVYAGKIGLLLQPASRFQLKASASLAHKQNHFVTNARTGRDSGQTDDRSVALTGPYARIERNPVYNPGYDSPGNRFRVEGYTVWNFMITTALQF